MNTRPMIIKTNPVACFVILLCAVFSAGATTFTVTTTNDYPVSGSGISVNTSSGVISGGTGSGQITLRSAVIAANANSGSTIVIHSGTYQLTIPPGPNEGNVDPDPTVGTLSVLASVTIQGDGPGQTILQAGTSLANSIDQIMVLNAYYWSKGQSAVVNGFQAAVSGITFQYGKCVNTNTQSGNYIGGAISFDAGYNNGLGITPGSLLVSNCVFNTCKSHWAGGAIGTFDGGTQTYVNCVFTNNNANNDLLSSGSGGAVVIGNTTVNPGTITFNNCTFINNQALTGAAGALEFEGGTPVYFIHNCLFSGNTAGSFGGALYSIANNLTMDGSTFTNNSSLGSIITTLQGSTPAPSQLAAGGGGVYISSGPDLISNCVFVANIVSTNSADERGGGAISLSGITIPGPGGTTVNTNATVIDCRIFGNVATNGSGLIKDNNPGTALANNNWWGNNGGPGVGGADTVVKGTQGSGGGVLASSNWLQLAFNAAPTTILTGGSSTLTASITKNSASVSGFSVPNGTPASFSGTLGTVSPGSTTTSSSAATSTFTAGSTGGTGTVIATVDKQSLTNTITINQPPLITSANSTTFTVGSNASFQVTKTGVPTPGLSQSGVLPSGVGFNTSTGVLSGTPGAGTGGTYPITFTATNAAGTNVQSFTLTVDQPPLITSANSTTFKVGSAGSFQVTRTGFPTPGLSQGGTLPSGVGFNTSTGVLSGTPGAGTGGTYPITFTATNAAGTNAQSFTLTVDQSPLVTSATSTVFTVGSAGSFQVSASGFPAPGLTQSGALPSGVGFNQGTGLLSGTPGAGTGGTYPISFTATNAAGTNVQSFTLTVDQAPLITSTTSTVFTVGSAGSFQVSASGFPSPGLSQSGALPNGVGFNQGTGMLSGTPAAGTGGTYPITFTATNAAGTNVQSFTLNVYQPPLITSTNNATFKVGINGVFTVTRTGNPLPDLFGSGTFPNGVGFNLGTGNISGTPAIGTGGIYPLVITATNAVGTNVQNFTLTVLEAPALGCPPNVTTNLPSQCPPTIPFNAIVTHGYPTPTVTYKLGTNVITSPYTFPVGTNTVTVTATNGVSPDKTCSFTVTVLAGTNQPLLNLLRSGSNAVVSWTNLFPCYTVQVATSLDGTNNWTDYAGPIATVGNNLYVTNTLGTNFFFRLKY